MSNDVNNCPACSEAGLLVCTCDFYRDWPTERPIIRPWLGRRAESFRWGHRSGRRDACRRLWSHLDPDGRQLASVIATEGDDD